MKVLLAAATPFEIQATMDPRKQEFPGLQTVITGVGSVATTYQLLNGIRTQHPELVIQAGIGGCFPGLEPGEVVIVEKDCFADLGVWENGRFRDLASLNLALSEEKWLINPHSNLFTLTGLRSVTGITVNEISTSEDRIKWYQQNLSPLVESMEGAALHYVCLREKIPFLQLRAVSNLVGVRNKAEWKMKEAISALNNELARVLKKIKSLHETDIRI